MHDMRNLLDISKRLLEKDLNKDEVEKIFKTASDSRKSSWFKDSVDVNDLLKQWNKQNFPTDSRDIVSILKSEGFSIDEINKVFKKTGYGLSDKPDISPAMEKVAEYIINSNYTEDILAFLKDNYKGIEDSYVKEGKMTVEDIRSVFTEIVKEERTELKNLIKQDQIKHLGRVKK